MIEIRDYQRQGIQEIYEAWKSVRRVMFQMPTGTGKTVLFNRIVKQELERGNTVLIIAHRQELIEQNARRLKDDFQINAGIIMGRHPTNLSLPVQVASIQTLSNRDYPSLNPSLIIIDEAHHVVAASYIKLLSEYPEARILGVTASPIRLSGEGFTDSFDTLITSKSIAEFIQDGHLAQIEYRGRKEIWSKLDLSSVSIDNKGDYDPNQLSLRMRQDFVMANLIQSYLSYAKGKKMIVFAVNVEHSEDIVKRYLDEGFAAAHLDAKTNKRKRNEIINEFKTGKIQILSNVNIVSEGFDVPDCEVVQLARPTKSLAMYLQQVGRCMRPSKNKPYSIILDNIGLYGEFGSPTQTHRDWTLEPTKNSSVISNSSSVNSEAIARSKPEETDEELILLEDVNMPIQSDTISKAFPKIDKELQLRIAIRNLKSKLKLAELRHEFEIEQDADIVPHLKQKKENTEQELQSLILEQEERLQGMLITFQEIVDDFFNNCNHWKNEDDKKIFSLRLKISYDLLKNRVNVILDDREKQVKQYLEVTDNDIELELRTEILQLIQSIKNKKRDVKALEKNNSIDDSNAKINELSSEISKLELNKDNKSEELYCRISNQEHRLEEIIINFRGLIYDFFNKNAQWESEDDKKNFVWRLQIFYDFLDDRVKFNLDKRFKKIISYLEIIINEISSFSSDKRIDNTVDYNKYCGNDGFFTCYDCWTTIVFPIIDNLIEAEYKSTGILSDELGRIYIKCFALVFAKHFDCDITNFYS